MDKLSFIKLFIGVTILCIILISKNAYSAYVKAPKEVNRLKVNKDDSGVVKWQEFGDKCKNNIKLIIAAWVFFLIIFASAI